MTTKSYPCHVPAIKEIEKDIAFSGNLHLEADAVDGFHSFPTIIMDYH